MQVTKFSFVFLHFFFMFLDKFERFVFTCTEYSVQLFLIPDFESSTGFKFPNPVRKCDSIWVAFILVGINK